MKFSIKGLKRIGKYRIVNASLRWGIDLFDDLQKLTDPADFGTVFDVGANVGEMSKLFLRHFPKASIHAFEPVESTFRILQGALEQCPRVSLHRLAASDTTGSATIRLFEDPRKNTLISNLSDRFHAKSSGFEQIETRRLDSVMSERQITSLSLLKIDVEGLEVRVLRGCGMYLSPATIRYVFCEFHRVGELRRRDVQTVDGHSKLGELDAVLEAHGYRVLAFYTQSVHLEEPLGTYNALYGA